MRIKRWERPSLSGKSEHITLPLGQDCPYAFHMVPSTVLTLPQHLLLPKSQKGICSRRSNSSDNISTSCVLLFNYMFFSSRTPSSCNWVWCPSYTWAWHLKQHTELKLLEPSSELVVLNLKWASESPGGPIRTDSWTPTPLFLIQYGNGGWA